MSHLYLQHFGLTEPPFSITPDPAFVYLSAAHREALAHLLYGVGKGGSGGFVQLTGEVGTGKTTICRCLLEQVPEDTLIALILNPLVSPQELLASICEELEIDITTAAGSSKLIVDALNRFLLEQYANGKRVVVVIDEAQNLSPEALEQVRLLTNLETAKHKLLQMVLLGQPELRQLLQRQNLRQLAQRITARYHLAPLNEEETFAYIRHRMRVAGARQSHFNRKAMKAVYRRSGGIPRLINIIADRALAGAYAQEKDTVSAALVHAAANEVQPSEQRIEPGYRWAWSLGAGLAAIALIFVLGWQLGWIPTSGSVSSPGAEKNHVSSAGTSDTNQAPDPIEEVDPNTQEQPLAEQIAENGSRAQTDVKPMGSGVGTATGKEAEIASTNAVGATSLTLRDPAWIYPGESPVAELTETWLADQHLLAYPALAQLWQEEGNASGLLLSCEGQTDKGFACLKERGNWARVRQLGLPVILVLRSNGDKHVLLRGIQEQQVLLGAGSSPRRFTRDQVDELWMGEFIVAWPQSPDWPDQIQKGDSSPAVDIVVSMASQAEPAWEGAGKFDAAFESWVKSFQLSHGLNPDGIVGPQTLLYLMAPGITEPRLELENREDS